MNQIDNLDGKATQFWHRINEDKIQCDLCPRFCQLQQGQRGLCFVRANHLGKIVSTSYGRSSGFCIDPIEKKPLNHFLPGTPVLSFGTAGCNLSCKYCQNWDMSKSRQQDTLADQASPEKIAQTALKYQCRSVAFTYNDPVIFHEYAIDVAQACHHYDIKSVAVSAAYVCEKPMQQFYQQMDAANIDLKAFSDEFYRKICGGHLQPVLDTLKYIKHKTNVWLEITTLLIPNKNDSDEELNAMTQWIAKELGTDVPLHFSAFHPDYKMNDVLPTSHLSLKRAKQIALKNGLRYVYLGNVHDKPNQSTYCHECGDLLIGRDWYELSEWHLDSNGDCKTCGTACVGQFEEAVGKWGAKRLPISLGI
ncbi:MAG: AmmeMemoRadiSam system radical SAM enzyme [Gammaproteobacteria bacterium]|nr:AmmeMemoRadiSam system radical SAM enzyme [Gammaproteobacteria bacterium]